MKRSFFFIFVFGLAAILAAQVAQDVLTRVVQAMGGPSALQNWNAVEAEGDLKYTIYNMEITGKFKMIRNGQQRWMRLDLSFSGQTYVMVQSYDAKSAWMQMRGRFSDMPTLNFETESRHEVDLLLQKEAAWSLGKEGEIEGRRVISLEAAAGGRKTVFWVDPATSLILEIAYKDTFISRNEIKEELDRRICYSDYQRIKGIMFPLSQVTYEKGKKSAELRFTRVFFEPKVSPLLFQRPAQKLDLRYPEEIID